MKYISLITFILFVVFVRSKTQACGSENPSEAIAACSFMIKHIPVDRSKVQFLIFRAWQYSRIGSDKEGIEDFNTLLKFHETKHIPMTDEVMAGIHEGLAILNYNLDNDEEALKYADISIQNGSKEPMLYMIRGKINVNVKNYSQGLIDLKIAENLKFNEPDLYLNLGSAYIGIGDYEEAYRSLKKVNLQESSPNEKARHNKLLGATCFKLGLYEEAKQSLQKILDAGIECSACSSTIKYIDKSLGSQ